MQHIDSQKYRCMLTWSMGHVLTQWSEISAEFSLLMLQFLSFHFFWHWQIKVTGDRVAFGEPALVICNHRTRVDWVFLWCLCLRQGQLSGLKIVLKDSLKGIPGFGWAAQVKKYGLLLTSLTFSYCSRALLSNIPSRFPTVRGTNNRYNIQYTIQ